MTSPGRPMDLRTRLGWLQAVRVVLGGLAALAALAGSGTVGDTILARADLVPLALAYVAATSAVEVARRAHRLRLERGTNLLLVVDCAFVAVAADPDRAVFVALAAVHVVAVVLLVSRAAGLRVSALHLLGLYVTAVGAAAAGRPGGSSEEAVVATGLLAIGVVAAVLSRVVEQHHGRQRRWIDALAVLGERCAAASGRAEIEATLVEHVVATFGFRRGAVAEEGGDGVRLARASMVLPGATNVLVVPLVAGEQSFGAAAFEVDPGAAGVPGDVVELVSQFCNHASLSLRNAALRADIERMATVDPLTDLPNRRRFDEFLRAEVERTRRRHGRCSLLALDIDHFKAVNDVHGHAVGDAVLQHLAALLRSACRAGDLPARTGGEEFWVVLPDTPADDAASMAERLRSLVAGAEGPVPITVSIGVGELPGSAADVVALQRVADEALYRAKHGGRDQVRVALPRRPRRQLRAAG